MRKVLTNTPRTKKYLDSLPKVYGLFFWAKWCILEFHWSGKYEKDVLVPLVYSYYDGNGMCDEYHLIPIHLASSGGFYGWYMDKEEAISIQKQLNK
jgi:hypothetical protein